jgi:hypothetical protein
MADDVLEAPSREQLPTPSAPQPELAAPAAAAPPPLPRLSPQTPPGESRLPVRTTHTSAAPRPPEPTAPLANRTPVVDHAGPPAPPAMRYASSPEKPETRIEIGHVEVRLTTPSRPAPARPPQRARGPLVRPAGLFGLRQS